MTFRCPHCSSPLLPDGSTLRCASGHAFDRAREGYVNLLVGGRLPGGPSGDDEAMVRARRAVFDAGLYAPIFESVAAQVAAVDPQHVLDMGCGEGSYLARAVAVSGATGWGVDVSKSAIRLAARRYALQHFAVASSYRLPFDDDTFDAIIDVFSPRPIAEMARVLRPGGVAVVVGPAADHLAQLKALVYERPRPHHNDEDTAPFIVMDSERVRFTLDLAQPTLRRHMLEMTPYWWSADDATRTKVVAELKVVDVDVIVGVLQSPS